MYRSLLISVYLLQFLHIASRAQSVKIGLFNEVPLKTVVISVTGNSFRVVCDSELTLTSEINEAYYLTISNDKLVLRNKQNAIGVFTSIKFIPLADGAFSSVTPVMPKVSTKQYTGVLDISVAYKRIAIINLIDLNEYIAGVVEAEAGVNASAEFYKAQAVLARTYVYAHNDKHISEGFNLCDGVHCQAYYGQATKNRIIREATVATTGLVALIDDTTYITAAFHANCGGNTESAQNAWLSSKKYMVPVKDPFCQNSSSARWEKKISLDSWRQYLKNHGFKNVSKLPYIDFSIVNTTRVQYYSLKSDSIPYKQIRSDFQLRSSFFSISATENELIFKGRGYGHGVGLCQDGAMQMAKIGYKFEEILKYYFKGIEIVKK